MFEIIRYIFLMIYGLFNYCFIDYNKEIDINLIKNFEDI